MHTHIQIRVSSIHTNNTRTIYTLGHQLWISFFSFHSCSSFARPLFDSLSREILANSALFNSHFPRLSLSLSLCSSLLFIRPITQCTSYHFNSWHECDFVNSPLIYGSFPDNSNLSAKAACCTSSDIVIGCFSGRTIIIVIGSQERKYIFLSSKNYTGKIIQSNICWWKIEIHALSLKNCQSSIRLYSCFIN